MRACPKRHISNPRPASAVEAKSHSGSTRAARFAGTSVLAIHWYGATRQRFKSPVPVVWFLPICNNHRSRLARIVASRRELMAAEKKYRLSVLDLSPVASGSTSADALRNTLDLAQLADGLGFTRYWLAEHHNTPLIASSAPEIMIGHVASVTKNIHVGSGGIMLPNHTPLKVAETFRV